MQYSVIESAKGHFIIRNDTIDQRIVVEYGAPTGKRTTAHGQC